MKQFKTLREETLEEKLKASDPAGTYIHDFVHSDNPKFADKSKAKRIQMALAASYAAKDKSRNEEVEQQDEGVYNSDVERAFPNGKASGVKTIAKKALKALTGGSDEDQRKDLQRKMGLPQTGKKPTSEEVEQIEEMDKSQTPPGRDGGYQFPPGPKVSKKVIKAINKDPAKHLSDLFTKEYSKKKVKEEVEQIDELSINTLTRVKHAATSAASDASREGDEEKATKRYNLAGNASNKIEKKNRAAGLAPSGQHAFEEVEQIDELSKSTLGSYAKKATRDARLRFAQGKDFERISKSSRKPEYKAGAKEWEDKYKSDARKREAGVNKAIDRLAKEEKELDEVNMTAHIKRQATRLKMKAGGLKTTNTTMQPRPRPTMEGSTQDATDTSMTIISKGISKLNKALQGKDPSSLVGTQTK